MKRHVLSLLTALCFVIFTSCDDEIQDDFESEVSGFVTCRTNGNGHIVEIMDDMGQKFKINDDKYVLDSNSSFRRICTYVIGPDSTAGIRGLYIPDCGAATDISTVGPAYRKFDPMGIESAYVGGGYLNIVMKIMTHDETSFRQHYIEAVRLDSPDSLVISFLHDANGDVPVYSRKLYFCIPLSKYDLQKNEAVFLKYTNYNEEDCCMKYIYR